MKVIEPKAELWSEENVTPEEHIARCARVCYGHNGAGKDPKKLVDGLIKNGHLSMLRHATRYVKLRDFDHWQCSEFVNALCLYPERRYASVNLQFAHENELGGIDEHAGVEDFLDVCRKSPSLFAIFRLTFCLTTQISTSRELNRISPNNIAERSTRYCSSRDGLEICKPWWWNDEAYEGYGAWTNRMTRYVKAWETAEQMYKELITKDKEKPEDARGVLPLDTATKVVYTYSVLTWQHILRLRYYGRTGTPHPNCKLAMGMVRDQINRFAAAHGINYQV